MLKTYSLVSSPIDDNEKENTGKVKESVLGIGPEGAQGEFAGRVDRRRFDSCCHLSYELADVCADAHHLSRQLCRRLRSR